MRKFIACFIALLLIFAACTACAATVHEGNRGVVIKWGKAQNEVLNPGFYWTAPWTSVKQMSVQWQRYEINASAYSKDIQQVDVLLSLSYQLKSDAVLDTYKSIGMNYADQIMLPRSIDAIKAVFARYSAEELISKRQSISSEIFNLIHDQMEGYGVNIKEVALENIDFTDSFEAAVEQKQVATQTKLKAQIEQDQAIAIAKADAEKKKIEAEARAEIIRIEANASAEAEKIKAEAEAYRLEQENKSISTLSVLKTLAETWNGSIALITVKGNN